MPSQTMVTATDRPDLAGQPADDLLAAWPPFLLHDRQAEQAMPRAWECFPQFNVRLIEDGAVIAGGWAVPLRWDATSDGLPVGGYDGALTVALAGYDNGEAPDTLCLMAAAVRPDRQQIGLGSEVVKAMRQCGIEAGLSRVIGPVRPTFKARYPLTPMASFARWSRDDGLHLDPWVRAHQRLGATILAPALDSMIVTGTVAEWESWTGMPFPETGSYVVHGALDLVEIDTDRDLGTYREPNLWMQHA